MPTKLDEQFEKALEKKFFCPTKFAQEIETLVLDNTVSYTHLTLPTKA